MVVKQLDDTETELGGVLVITPGVITEAADRLGHARDLRFDFRGDDLTVQRFARGESCQRFQCVVNLHAATGAPGSPDRVAITLCENRDETPARGAPQGSPENGADRKRAVKGKSGEGRENP